MERPEVLGLIPARGGSRGILRKNLALLAGRPLLAYTCDAARSSLRVTRTVVSTDSEEIAEASRALGAAPLLRPAALAADDTPMVEVVRHALHALADEAGYRPDVVVLLQPTSPLRRAEHIDGAVDLLLVSSADAVVSVVEVPHNLNPTSVMRSEGGRLVPFLDGPSAVLRQQKPRLYARNGPAVLAVRPQSVMERGLYDGDVRAFVMERRCSIDIDEEIDLRLAEFWLAQGGSTAHGAARP